MMGKPRMAKSGQAGSNGTDSILLAKGAVGGMSLSFASWDLGRVWVAHDSRFVG